MSKKLPFTVTEAHKEAVKRYLLAKAFNDVVQPQFKRMEKEIIEKGNFKIADSYYTNEKYKILNLPEDRIMRNTETLYMLDGHQDRTEISGDAVRFYQMMKETAIAEGFADGENTAAKSDYELVKATRNLIEVTADISNMTIKMINNICGTENYYKLLDLVLRLLVPLVPDTEIKANLDIYFAKKMSGTE